MTLQISPETQARIAEMVERGSYADADSMLDQALALLAERERHEDLKQAIAAGVKEVAEGKVVEFTPALRERLWRQAIAEAATGSGQDFNGQD